MRLPVAIANGVPVTLARPFSPTINVPFTSLFLVDVAGSRIVTTAALLGGLTFTATIITSVCTVYAVPVVLLGSTVTRSDGYTGVVGPEHCALSVLMA